MERGRWPPPTATARARPHRKLLRAQSPKYLLKLFLYMLIGIHWGWLSPALILLKVMIYKFSL